ncbi:hypothetical protein AB3S75_033375 [Citrus x aurantiifolia]
MTILVTLCPDPSPHVHSSPSATQEVGFANTILGSSPSFYADPGPGLAFWEARSLVKDLVGCGTYSTRSGTDVDDIITTSLFVPLGMLNTTSPTGVTCAFVSLSVVSTGCF